MKLGTLDFISRYQKSTLQCLRKSVSRRVCTLLVSHVYKVEEEQLSKPIIRITGIGNEYKSDLKAIEKT